MKSIDVFKCAMTFVALSGAILSSEAGWDQSGFEKFLQTSFHPQDDYVNCSEEVHIPFRERDALPGFERIFAERGCTTNELIFALIAAATNNIIAAKLNDENTSRIAAVAIAQLRDINDPAVTNFFKSINESDFCFFSANTILGMFQYTHLESDVLSYMKTICVRTNLYDGMADSVLWCMQDGLHSLPENEKISATSRLAQYFYYAIRNITDSQEVYDNGIMELVPAYSNSLQRLETMRYIATTATNVWQRMNASNIVINLSVVPTNELSDVSWLGE